jgi:hypothetical protein
MCKVPLTSMHKPISKYHSTLVSSPRSSEWVGSLKICSTSHFPQHQFHNLDYGPRIAPMYRVTEFISWQIIQLRVRTT